MSCKRLPAPNTSRVKESQEMGSQVQLNDFPNEILINIFKYVPISDRIEMRHVCRRWMELCLLDIKQIVFGKCPKFENETFDGLPFWTMPDPLNEYELYFENDNFEDYDAIYLIQAAGHSLKQIFLDEQTCEDLYNGFETSFFSALSHCPNIKSLRFLSSVSFSLYKKFLKFFGKNLEEFECHGYDDIFSDGSGSEDEIQERYGPCTYFLQHLNCDKLRKLSLNNVCIEDNIGNCLSNLTHLKMVDSYFGSKSQDLKSLRHLKVFHTYDNYGCLDDLDWIPVEQWSDNLTELIIEERLDPCYWKLTSLKGLKNLQHLKFVACSMKQIDYVDKHLQQLESLSIRFYDCESDIATFPSFADFEKLVRFEIDFYRFVGWHPDIFEAVCIPSLRIFQICVCFNSSNGADTFFNQLFANLPKMFPSLEKLEYKECETETFFDVQTLCDGLKGLNKLTHFKGTFGKENVDKINILLNFGRQNGIQSEIKLYERICH